MLAADISLLSLVEMLFELLKEELCMPVPTVARPPGFSLLEAAHNFLQRFCKEATAS